MMKKFLFRALRISGLPFLFRELIQKNKVTILLFHDISKETAEQSFSYLSRNYEIIDLNHFIEACEAKGINKIPPKALIITFDDGYIRNYEILPVIRKYNIPVTFFVCTSIINTNRHFWYKFLSDTLAPYELHRKSNLEKLDILSRAGFELEQEFTEPQALQKAHINEMKHYVNFQSHTMFHPILPKCNDLEARTEIFESKRMLELEYGLTINAISYPRGDYSERDIQLSKQAGYKCGITVDFGFNTLKTDIFRLKRLCVNDTDNINELIVKSSGVWDFFKTRNGRKQKYGFSNSVGYT
jgi:peptidoglycan/xylan/chitin deacetylase (PgdA/CDA1 family)